MNQERLMNILLGPHISEKASRLGEEKTPQVVFKVATNARKPEIKKAVELMFEVEVDQVRIVRVKGKHKSFGRVQGRRSNWKKAYVKLKPGHDIDFMGAE